jgi:hypothetical protein
MGVPALSIELAMKYMEGSNLKLEDVLIEMGVIDEEMAGIARERQRERGKQSRWKGVFGS